MPSQMGLRIVNEVIEYLLYSGWYRDSDDPGIWRKDGQTCSISDAFGIQIVKDGIEWPDA